NSPYRRRYPGKGAGRLRSGAWFSVFAAPSEFSVNRPQFSVSAPITGQGRRQPPFGRLVFGFRGAIGILRKSASILRIGADTRARAPAGPVGRLVFGLRGAI